VYSSNKKPRQAEVGARKLRQEKGMEIRVAEFFCGPIPGGGEGVLHIMVYTGRLHPKGVPFSGFKYIKGLGFHKFRNMKG